MTSLYECAIRVLNTGDVFRKATLTKEFARQWTSGEIPGVLSPGDAERLAVPDTPAHVVPVVANNANANAGSKKLGKFIHGVLHAEGYAIDLMWDLIARFRIGELPREFYDDWVKIAGEEATHFEVWAERLTELTGSGYGSFPVHDGLWQSALDTKNDLLGRLAVVHAVHEARGLDVYPKARAKLEDAKDERSLAILTRNYLEEISHVGAAIKWFERLCESPSPESCFHAIVRKHYHGRLIAPFNTEARSAAGMSATWYLPLA